MKELLKTNCFDTGETMIIVGSCLKYMAPNAFKQLEEISNNLYEVCLEETHLNMVVTKVIGMLAREKVKKLTIIYTKLIISIIIKNATAATNGIKDNAAPIKVMLKAKAEVIIAPTEIGTKHKAFT